ncbi:hypothetical protein NPIL_444411 [Nephila pilipes]|uniref:Uncharacterized protein n=1 Tax=Nephila pilipes TaxID=299642 RepID=A0A8X6ML62_NEPPI|nr:hypothetical protein NPIL_444411 [Nephila pilipes]
MLIFILFYNCCYLIKLKLPHFTCTATLNTEPVSNKTQAQITAYQLKRCDTVHSARKALGEVHGFVSAPISHYPRRRLTPSSLIVPILVKLLKRIGISNSPQLMPRT